MKRLTAVAFLVALLIATTVSAAPPTPRPSFNHPNLTPLFSPAIWHAFAEHGIKTDDCGWILFGVGTYGDWSEIEASISYCQPSGIVHGCTVQPDCYNGEHPPMVSLGPGEAPESFFGFSPWAGYTPCEAITHAQAFVCPFNMNPAAPPDPFVPVGGGPDIQPPQY